MAPITLPSQLFNPRSLPSDLTDVLSTPAIAFTRLRDAPTHITSPVISRTLRLFGRQSDPSIIPTAYGSINSGPSAGTVVGIVLGSVGGFLLLLWLIYTCLSFGTTSASTYSESIVVRDRRKSHHGSRRSRSRQTSETVEIRRPPSMPMPIPMPMPGPPPPPRMREPERAERIIVEESRKTRRALSPESSAVSDEVVVIEEHSPPKRKKSTRERDETRDSGYRTVDPGSYGGVVGGRRKSTGRR